MEGFKFIHKKEKRNGSAWLKQSAVCDSALMYSDAEELRQLT